MTPFEYYANNWYINRLKLKDLLYFQIHLTTRCQNACKHCYFREIIKCEKDFLLDKLLLFLATVKEKADQLKVPCNVDFTGGDPFLYPYLMEAVEFCKKNGINYGFKGNPEEIIRNPDVITNFLINSSGISLSLDGMEETHDYFRSAGSFHRTFKAIEILKEYGIHLRINTTISKKNVAELIPLMDFLVEQDCRIDDYTWSRYWSLTNIQDIITSPVLNRVFDEMSLYLEKKLSSREFYYYSSDGRFVPKIMFSFKEHQWYPYLSEKGVLESGIVEYINSNDNCINCTATKHVYIVDPDMTIYKCRKLPETMIPLDLIGTEKGCDYTKGRFLKCRTCKYYNGCGGCSAIAKSLCGDLTEIEPNCPYYFQIKN